METIIAIAIVALAALLIIRSFWKSAKADKRDGCACGGKNSCPAAELCDPSEKKDKS